MGVLAGRGGGRCPVATARRAESISEGSRSWIVVIVARELLACGREPVARREENRVGRVRRGPIPDGPGAGPARCAARGQSPETARSLELRRLLAEAAFREFRTLRREIDAEKP